MTRVAPSLGLATWLLAAVVAMPAAAQTPAAQGPVKDQGATKDQGSTLAEYRIGPEDTVQISVWKNDAISRTVPVRPDGKISLPLLNDVQAAGLTPMELREILNTKLKEFIPSPEVSVIVLEPKSFKITLIGEVPKPGRYELRSRTTVLDLLAMAGGVTQFAARSRIFVIRRDDTGQKKVGFNYNRAIAADGERENFDLQPNDIVIVP